MQQPHPSRSIQRPGQLTVCQPKELPLSSGDRLQLKANGKSQDGRRLANGELATVKEIRADGRIALDDGRILEKSYHQFMRGYAVTSYSAQGKTVDYVLFSDSAVKAATNDQQWYVTISRGRKGIRIFTADKQQLRESITHSGERPLAMELQSVLPEHSPLYDSLARRFGEDVAQSFERGQFLRVPEQLLKRLFIRHAEVQKKAHGVRM